MTKQTEAMKAALTAMKSIDEAMPFPVAKFAIRKLEEALAEQPAQQKEPVATMWQHGETGRTRITMPGDITDCGARWFKVSDLYTSPQPSEPLTDEEIGDLWDGHTVPVFGKTGINPIVFARAIEAAHGIKERNT